MSRIDWKNTIVPKVKELLEGYGSNTPTLRQVYYRLVAAQLIPNKLVYYQQLSRNLTLAREQGIIDPYALEDRNRESKGGDYGSYNSTPKSFVKDRVDGLRFISAGYNQYIWIGQEYQLYIWVEKDALFPTVCGIVDKYRIEVYQARGYSSFIQVYGLAKDMRRFEHKKIIVLFLTDFDASGEDMVRDVTDRLKRYGNTEFTSKKIALTYEQVKRLNLPFDPAKKTDPRAKEFIKKYGDMATELDAIPPELFEEIILKEVKSYIDFNKWENIEKEIKEARREIDILVTEILNKLKENEEDEEDY